METVDDGDGVNAVALVPHRQGCEALVVRFQHISRALGLRCLYFFPIHDDALAHAQGGQNAAMAVARRAFVSATARTLRARFFGDGEHPAPTGLVASWSDDPPRDLGRLIADRQLEMILAPVAIDPGPIRDAASPSSPDRLAGSGVPVWLARPEAPPNRKAGVVIVIDRLAERPVAERLLDLGAQISSRLQRPVKMLVANGEPPPRAGNGADVLHTDAMGETLIDLAGSGKVGLVLMTRQYFAELEKDPSAQQLYAGMPVEFLLLPDVGDQ